MVVVVFAGRSGVVVGARLELGVVAAVGAVCALVSECDV